MIEIKAPTHGDILRIEELIKSNISIYITPEPYISNCMVAYDKGKIIGATGFIQKNDFALITFIVVDKGRRMEYIGEGLTKALLNMANNRRIKKVIANWDLEFFLKLGFSTVSNYANEYNKIFEKDLNLQSPILEVTLPDYFLKGCKSSSNIKRTR